MLPVGRVHIGPGLPAALAGGIGMAVMLGLVFIVPALAVALVGRLRSLAAVCAAGLALGCAQSEVTMLREHDDDDHERDDVHEAGPGPLRPPGPHRPT